MEKYLIIYGHMDNVSTMKDFTWRETLEGAKKFKPCRPDWVVFQIIHVPEGKGY